MDALLTHIMATHLMVELALRPVPDELVLGNWALVRALNRAEVGISLQVRRLLAVVRKLLIHLSHMVTSTLVLDLEWEVHPSLPT